MDSKKRAALKARHNEIKAARAARLHLDKVLTGARSAVFTTPEIARHAALSAAQVRG